MKILRYLSLGIGLTVVGCASSPQDTALEHPSLNPWRAEGEKWWLAFKDPFLNKLVHHVLNQSLDLQMAYLRLHRAHALKKGAAADLFPQVSGIASFKRSEVALPKSQNYGQAGLDGVWEADISGRLRASLEEAEAEYRAEEAGVDDARILIIAELARTVVEWRHAVLLTKSFEELVGLYEELISLLQSRATAGLDDSRMLEKTKAQSQQVFKSLQLAQANTKMAQYQLERLLNIPEDALEKDLLLAYKDAFTLPDLQHTLKLQVETLRNRPDIRKAQALLESSQAMLKGAEASLWPRLSLGAFFGVQDGSNGLHLASNPISSLTTSLTFPLLNFGRVQAAIEAADVHTKHAVLSFKNTLNRAVQETRTALSDYVQGQKALGEQERGIAARGQAIAMAKARFEKGLADMMDLSAAEIDFQQDRVSFLQQQQQTAIAYIRLQKALGI